MCFEEDVEYQKFKTHATLILPKCLKQEKTQQTGSKRKKKIFLVWPAARMQKERLSQRIFNWTLIGERRRQTPQRNRRQTLERWEIMLDCKQWEINKLKHEDTQAYNRTPLTVLCGNPRLPKWHNPDGAAGGKCL